jgi:hypothetical protein
MKSLFPIFILLLFSLSSYGQQDTVELQGTVSYLSSQNVYLKFASTEFINKGDTLFQKIDDRYSPALLVKDKSSTSCICASLLPEKVKVGDVFFAKVMMDKKPENEDPKKVKENPVTVKDSSGINLLPTVIAPQEDKIEEGFKEKLRGRISAASYSNFYGEDITHRMRYTLTFQGNNIKNSRFSTDNYITFRHTLGEWQEVKENFRDALKIYSMSVKYDFDKNSSVSLGRKINYRISSMGAIDGLQVEKGLGHFVIGAIAGSRPDYTDYGINFDLFQAGGYVSHGTLKNNKNQESTVAFVEQRNLSKTDRRFTYFQHSNSLIKDLHLFGSFEVDLFQNINDTISNKPSLTNLLFTMRYRVSKKISINAAYDNRKNIIYYESYKSYIDQLIDDETRQGLRVGANYHISKLFTWGFNASWRFQKSEINLSKNLNTYLNISKLPIINATASLSANILQTSYLDSKIFGIRISKEIIRSKLNSELYFRMVEYNYKNYENKISQEIAGASLSWNITRKLSFYLYYEGTFDKANQDFNRFNLKLIHRL